MKKQLQGTFPVRWVPEPVPGPAAVVYRLQPSTTQIKKEKDGSYSPSVVSCERLVKVGDEPQKNTSEGVLYYQFSNGIRTRYSSEITIPKDAEWLIFDWVLDNSSVDRITIQIVADGKDGDNAFVVDADDEMIPVAIVEDDKAYGQSQTVTINAFYGTTPITLLESEYSATPSNGNLFKVTKQGNKIKIDVTKGQSWTDVKKEFVTVSVNHSKYGKRTIKISLYPAFPGKDSIIYSLQPSHSSFVFGRDENDNIIGETVIFTLSVVKHNGAKVEVANGAPTGYTALYGFGNGTMKPFENQKNLTLNILPSHAQTYRDLKVSLQKGLLVVDKESIPFVIDGKRGMKGKDGTSVNIISSLNSESELPPKGNPGDGYLINGILYVWNSDKKDWFPVGKIQGPAGDSAYVHVAYTNKDETGQIVQSDFSTTESEGRSWVAFYADSNVDAAAWNSPLWKWMLVSGSEGLTISVVNEKLAWRREDAEEAFVGIDILQGTKRIPYGKEGFTISALANDPSLSCVVVTSHEKYTCAYKLSKRAGISVNKDIAFTIYYRNVEYNREISIRTTEDGNSITEVNNMYLASDKSTGVLVTDVGWTPQLPTLDSTKRYLWAYEVIKNSLTEDKPTTPRVIGYYSEDGKGIENIYEEYALSRDKTTAPPESAWKPTIPPLDSVNKYLWNREKIVYTDGSEKPIPPHIIGVYGDKGDKGDKGDTGASAAPNLLNATSFRGKGLHPDKWNVRITEEWQNKYEQDVQNGYAEFADVDNGFYNTKYMYARVVNGVEPNYINLLQQQIIRDKDYRRVRKGAWYTLSFFVKGHVVVYIYSTKKPYPRIVNPNGYVDGTFKSLPENGCCPFYDKYDADWHYHTITFQATETDSEGQILFRIFTNPEKYPSEFAELQCAICCIKLEEGKNATPWCASEMDRKGAEQRISHWNENSIEYLQGLEGESSYDVVCYRETEGSPLKFARCRESHVSSPKTKPGTDGGDRYWNIFFHYENIATDLVLARQITSEEIDVDSLSVSHLETKRVDNGPSIRIKEGLIEVFGTNPFYSNIRFGIKDGMAVLEYYDNEGRKLYDLGPKGIVEITGAKMVPVYLCYICPPFNPPTAKDVTAIQRPVKTTYYRYQAGDLYSEGNGEIHTTAAMNGQLPTSPLIQNGWYTDDFGAAEQEVLDQPPTGPNVILMGFFAPHTQYSKRRMFLIQKGKPTYKTITVYWAGGGMYVPGILNE